jgi:hypothetical protein
MDVGEPQREIIVEPLELPEPLRPASDPEKAPKEQPEEEYVDSVDVVGTVEIWGRVIECRNGFRSEYAYPKELWLLRDGLEHLSWTYGVPVRKL